MSNFQNVRKKINLRTKYVHFLHKIKIYVSATDHVLIVSEKHLTWLNRDKFVLLFDAVALSQSSVLGHVKCRVNWHDLNRYKNTLIYLIVLTIGLRSYYLASLEISQSSTLRCITISPAETFK